MTFIVYRDEYPFNYTLGSVVADTPEEALKMALKEYGNHCIIGPA